MTHFIYLTPHRARFAPRCRSAIAEWRAIERRERLENLTMGILGLLAGVFIARGVIMVIKLMLP